MRVVPEKTQCRANQRTAKNGQFSDAGDVLDFEVGGPAKIAADVSEDGESACRDYGAADGQAVQAVGEIYGVRGAHDDDGRGKKKRHKRQRPQMSAKS